jgi:MIP family channel proteins
MARALLAEAIGTFMIVVGGCGVVCTAVTTGAQAGIWHVAVVWGFTVTLAIYCTADASGAHLNPAITLAFWLVRPEAHGMNWRSVLAYMAAQLLGGIMGGALNLAIFAESFAIWEKKNNIVRGSPESVVTAAAFGEYFPNPGFVPSRFEPDSVSVGMAFVTEAWGTLILAFVIFSVTCKRNGVLSGTGLQPFFIGFTVAVLLSLYAPITQAGWNPARDFGPRIVAALAGWGSVAIPGPRNGFWVYIVAPLVGGPLGAFLAEIGLWGKWWKRLDGRRVGHSESQREMCRQC